MGGFVPVLKFIGAIFVGAGAGASAGYVFAVNVARVALLALSAKAFAPKIDLTEAAVTKSLTVRDPIAPQTGVYGEDMVSGPVLFTNVKGTDNRDLFVVVGLVGHEIDSIQGYRLDDTDIPTAQLSGSEDGVVQAPNKFATVATVSRNLGAGVDTAMTSLRSEFPSLFNTNHTSDGWAWMMWEFNLVEGQEETFNSGAPQNLRAIVRGKKVYDPRLDSTNGGSGLHRLADPATWEWSDNPALCLADFMRDDKFGYREEDDRIDWPLCAAAADICDGTVAIPTASTQARYTCNLTYLSTESRASVKDEIVASMAGRMVFSQGLWKMWAGAAIVPDVTLTEANLGGGIALQAASPSQERYNRVRGKFVDPTRNYTAAAYPEQRSSTFVTEDGNEVRELVLDQTSCNNTYEAQRKAIIKLRQSRLQRVVVFEGNLSCFRIQPGTTVLLDVAEYGFSGEKFFVTEWKFGENGIQLTMVQEDDTVWADPLEGDYSTRSETGALVFGETGVPAPTNLAAQTLVGGVVVTWDAPLGDTYSSIEIWRSADNDRNNATLIGTVPAPATRYQDIGAEVVRNRYYWARSVNRYGSVSSWEPNLTTTTAVAFPQQGESPMVADPFIRLGASYWDVTDSNASYQIGQGLDGTDAIRFTLNSNGAFARTAARRGPSEWDVTSGGSMLVEVRWRFRLFDAGLDSGSMGGGPIPRLYITDEDETNQSVYTEASSGLDVQDTDAGTWYDAVSIIEVTDTGTPPRYIQVGFLMPSNLLAPSWEIDFVTASIIGSNFAGAGKPGFVPDPSTESGAFLKDDGTWADPAVSAINNQNGNYTLVASDAGGTIYKNGTAASDTITIPSNAAVAFEVGTLIGFDVDNAGADMTININSDTLVGTDNLTGSRTLTDGHRAVIQKVSATRWKYAASDL